MDFSAVIEVRYKKVLDFMIIFCNGKLIVKSLI